MHQTPFFVISNFRESMVFTRRKKQMFVITYSKFFFIKYASYVVRKGIVKLSDSSENFCFLIRKWVSFIVFYLIHSVVLSQYKGIIQHDLFIFSWSFGVFMWQVLTLGKLF